MTELTNILKERSLPTDGAKDSLISRLEAFDAANDPSLSPMLHLSPVLPQAQVHKPTPTSIPNHLPNELDEEYCLNWDDDGDVDDAAGSATIVKVAEAAKATEAAVEAESVKVTGDSHLRIKSDPIAVAEEPAQPNIDLTSSSTSIEKVSKSGYKYKSIAATFFPEHPKSSTTAPSNVSVKTPAGAIPGSSSTATLAKVATNPLGSTSSTSLSGGGSKPTSTAPSNALSRAPTLSGSIKNSTATTTVATTATTSKENTTPKPTNDASRVKTTKSGYKFNSIASLFPETVTTPTSTKSQHITNMVTDTTSTYAKEAKLTPKEEEAKKLAMRATRFGVATKEPEVTAKEKKQGRSTQLDTVDEYSAKERERQIEIEKEKEREKIRQRVTTTKRQRNDDDDDRRLENQHRYNRQSQYRSPNTKANYYPRRRY